MIIEPAKADEVRRERQQNGLGIDVLPPPAYSLDSSSSSSRPQSQPYLSSSSSRHGALAHRSGSGGHGPPQIMLAPPDDDDDVDSDPETGGKARQRALKILKARNEMPAAGEHIITLFRGHPQMELTWGPGCRHVEKFGLKQTA